MKVLKYLKYIVTAIPLIKALVEAFEGEGHGTEKKARVLEALYKTLRDFGLSEKIIGYVSDFADWFIDLLVWIKNLCGEFKHKKEETS